ncbi:MAG: hypothetical protein NTW49_06990 [Bacteroidia bacterium]|nr:hypothetical protein [Bacteroidia bacterium]
MAFKGITQVNNDSLPGTYKINLNPDRSGLKKFISDKPVPGDHIQFVDNISVQEKLQVILRHDSIIWKCGEPITDSRDGRKYKTVRLDGRCWMAENLNIGTKILSKKGTNNQTNEQTDNNIIEKFCYENDSNACDRYGGLYQWDEAMQYRKEEKSRGICPEGWHIPSDLEWNEMVEYIGGRDVAGDILKAASFPGKLVDSVTCGFNALPGGRRGGPKGNYIREGKIAYFWTSTEYTGFSSWFYKIFDNTDYLSHYFYLKSYGFSVRCIRDVANAGK